VADKVDDSGPLVFISAGDPSGDIAASRLYAELKKLHPSLRSFGLGGQKLRLAGQEQLAEPKELAVLGFWEVAKRYIFFRKLFYTCIDEIKGRKPNCIILVDYPGFNLRLAHKLRALKLGIPIIYYIAPQVWAWGAGRIPKMKTDLDRLLVILSFEKHFFAGYGIATDFVGHYLLEDIPEQFRDTRLPDSKQIALLPGSRPQEIGRMLGPMLEAARLFNAKHGTQAVVAGISNGFDYERELASYAKDNISVLFEDSRKIIHESSLALTASGTATLECGIIGRPMVVVYKTSVLTYQIARRLVRLKHIGLVNLVLGEKVVPELIQHDATPQRMADELTRFWSNPALYKETASLLIQARDVLGGHGASCRAARIIADYL